MRMIAALFGLVTGNSLVAALVAAAIASVGYVYVKGRIHGADKVVRTAVKTTEKISAKAAKKSAGARKPGSAARLQREFCRDC